MGAGGGWRRGGTLAAGAVTAGRLGMHTPPRLRRGRAVPASCACRGHLHTGDGRRVARRTATGGSTTLPTGNAQSGGAPPPALPRSTDTARRGRRCHRLPRLPRSPRPVVCHARARGSDVGRHDGARAPPRRGWGAPTAPPPVRGARRRVSASRTAAARRSARAAAAKQKGKAPRPVAVRAADAGASVTRERRRGGGPAAAAAPPGAAHTHQRPPPTGQPAGTAWNQSPPTCHRAPARPAGRARLPSPTAAGGGGAAHAARGVRRFLPAPPSLVANQSSRGATGADAAAPRPPWAAARRRRGAARPWRRARAATRVRHRGGRGAADRRGGGHPRPPRRGRPRPAGVGAPCAAGPGGGGGGVGEARTGQGGGSVGTRWATPWSRPAQLLGAPRGGWPPRQRGCRTRVRSGQRFQVRGGNLATRPRFSVWCQTMRGARKDPWRTRGVVENRIKRHHPPMPRVEARTIPEVDGGGGCPDGPRGVDSNSMLDTRRQQIARAYGARTAPAREAQELTQVTAV